MKDITQLLQEAGQGDRSAADQVVAQLYGDLQRLARQRIRQAGEMTLLDTTALVHEAWLRLAGAQGQTFPDRRHFLAYAARTMRHHATAARYSGTSEASAPMTVWSHARSSGSARGIRRRAHSDTARLPPIAATGPVIA